MVPRPAATNQVELVRSHRFVVQRTLAETSAHALVLARDRRTSQRVVLKIARTGGSTTAREAEALRALAGEGVVELLDLSDDPPGTLVLAHRGGRTLEARLERSLLSPLELAELGASLFETLTRIWRSGWVHGDIKPANILWPSRPGGRPTLIDFECAARIGEPLSLRLTTSFSAPERVMSSPVAHSSSDVFSLGATLFACVRGASPFAGPSRDASVVRLFTHEPAMLRELPVDLATQIAAMLEKEPAARPLAWAVGRRPSSRPNRSARGEASPPAAPRSSLTQELRSHLRSRAGAPLLLDGPGASSFLEELTRQGRIAGRTVLLLGPSDEPYGSLGSALGRMWSAEARSFRDRSKQLRVRFGKPMTLARARQLTWLFDPDVDESSARALEPFRRDPELLRRARSDAIGTLLRALAPRFVIVVRRGADGHSVESVRELRPKPPLLVERGAIGTKDEASAADPEDVAVVARGLASSGESLRGAYHAWRGAERAFEASVLPRAVALAELADELAAASRGPVAQLLAALVAVTQARLGRWTGDFDGALLASRKALATLPSGSLSYCDALAERALVLGKRGDAKELRSVAAALRDPIREGAELAWDRAASRTAVQLYYAGESATADDLVALFLGRTTRASGEPDEERRGLSPGAIVTASLFHGRLDEHLARLEVAVTAFRRIGDVRSECLYDSAVGFALCLMGLYGRAASHLEKVHHRARRSKIRALVAAVEHNWGEALAHVPGKLERAIEIETSAIDALRGDGDMRLLAGSLAYRAHMWRARGDAERAEIDAREAARISAGNASLAPFVLATLALVELERGRIDHAEEVAASAGEALSVGVPIEIGGAMPYVARATVARRLGRDDEVKTIVDAALTEIELKSQRIRSRAFRKSFLARGLGHAELVRLREAIR